MSWRFVTCTALFVASLLAANTMAAKLIVLGGLVLSAAIVIFPLSYVLGDVLTEVWGYGAARRVIWLG
ncbi:MAG TPA: transporter, partial [Candidatus Rokubacteria bacterium]|nr:transporter [Candidatus Rokubacteria bacterium]